MAGLPQVRMDVDAFLAWSATVPGRYELADGEVFRWRRSGRVTPGQFAVQSALDQRPAGPRLVGEMLPDGITVRIAPTRPTSPTPWSIAPQMDPDAIEAPPPVIVVEVHVAGNPVVDAGAKLAGYFLLPAWYIICCSIRGAPA